MVYSKAESRFDPNRLCLYRRTTRRKNNRIDPKSSHSPQKLCVKLKTSSTTDLCALQILDVHEVANTRGNGFRRARPYVATRSSTILIQMDSAAQEAGPSKNAAVFHAAVDFFPRLGSAQAEILLVMSKCKARLYQPFDKLEPSNHRCKTNHYTCFSAECV
jgi:hypothetical protein